MTRTLHADTTAELATEDLRDALLIDLAFADGTVRFWSGIGDLVWSGDTFTGTGSLGEVSKIEETADLRAVGVQLKLSGIPASLLAIALGEHYQGRLGNKWLALFDANWAIIDDPILMFTGKMDVMVIEVGQETGTIQVNLEHRLIDLNRARERRYTPEDQNVLYPNDRGLDNVASLQDKDIVWGKS